MALSNKTFQNLANALTPEVIDYIFKDERWADFLMEIVPDAIEEKLGKLDFNVSVELSQCIMDRINLSLNYKTL